MLNQEVVQAFRAHVKRMMDYKSALDLLDWDAQTYMPVKGMQARADARGTLSAERFRMSVSDQMQGFLSQLEEQGNLDAVTKRMVEVCRSEYDRNRKVPEERFEAYVVLTTQAQSIWAKARREDDFAQFAPYLAKVVEMKREFVGYWGFTGHPYDALLDEYEPGLTVATLDAVFAHLRDETMGILQKIGKGNQPDTSFLERYFDPAKQKQFSEYILLQLGYDLEAGRLDETAHPFCTTIAPGDVRITTRYLPHFFNSALFGTIHECGHALYEQNVGSDLAGTNLYEGTSMGIHESQSRFWENIVGRSNPFWERYYGELQRFFPEQLSDVSVDQFYAAVNTVKPSLIRVEADEVTYNLHIMVRYEIEKGLMAGELAVADLPEIWREKMHKYLGIKPDSDRDGVLQDVHWSAGLMGYFPSYALGNLNSAQFAHTMRKQIPHFEQDVRAGEFSAIRAWLKEHIHQFGKLKVPAAIVQDTTGEPTTDQYLLQYFQKKYGSLYQF